MADDITLKMNVDTSDAVWAIDKFNSSAEKAFKSSNTATQAWGTSLNKVTSQMTKIVSRMTDLEAGKLPEKEVTRLKDKLKETNAEITKTEKYIEKLSKHPVETAEYAQWKTILANANTELKKAESTLSSYNKPTAWTEEFRGTTKEISKLQAQLDAAKSKLYAFESVNVTSGDKYDSAKEAVRNLSLQLEDAKERQQELIDTGNQYADQAGFDKATQDVKLYTNQVEQAEQAMYALEANGAQFDTTELDTAKIDLQELRDEAEQVKTALRSPYTGDGTQTTEYQQLAGQLTECYNKGTILDNKINDVNRDLRKTTGSSSAFKNGFVNAANNIISKLRSIKGETGKTQSSHNKSFKSMLTTVLKYGFGIRSIFLLYKKVRSTISTGLTEMSKQFSDVADDVYTLKNSWSGFKSSLVSAFQPILSYVVPILSTLINYLTSAMNAIANFFALLTGQSYYYKAVKGNESVADSIGGTGSAAAEANEELAEYDDLIVIDQDSSSGGSGGSGSSDGDAWNWEKVDVTASSLADKLSNIWDVFKSAWENKGQAVIDAATTAFNSVKSLLSTIASTIYDVFVSGTGQTWVESVLTLFTSILTTIGLIASAWETAWKKDGNGYKLVESIFNMFTAINTAISTIQDSWNKAWSSGTGVSIVEDVLQSLTNINNTITNIATNFTEAWNTAGVGDEIMETILDIVEDITDFINQITESTEEWSASLDFYPLLESVSGVLDAIEGVIVSIKEIALDIYNNIVLPLSKKIIESYLPTLLEDAETGLNSISTLLDSLPWDTITTALERISELLIEIGLAHINDNLSSTSVILEELGSIIESTTSIWSSFKDIIEGIFGIEFDDSSFESFKSVIATLSSQGNLASVSLKLMKAGLEAIATVMEDVAAVIDENKDTLINLGSDIWEGIKEGFETVWDWTEPIREFFNGIVDKIKEIFGINSPAENVKYLGEDILLGIIQGFKDKFTDIGTTVSNLYTTFKSKLSEKFKNFSITDILGNAGSIAITLTTTLAGGLTKLADFTSVSTFFTNVKTKWNNLKSTLKTTLSGAFTKITGEGSTLSTLSTKWKELKESWTDKLATLKATVGGQMSQVSDITTWKSYFNDLKTTWSDKTATLKAQVGGQIDTIEDMVGDSASSWKSKFTNFVDKVWNDDTATMKAEATVGGSSDGTLSKLVSGGSWYDRFTGFTKLWGTTYTSTMKATANIGGSTDDSLSNFASDTGSTWRKKFNDFTALWGKTTTATFDAAYHNADTNSAGYQAYCNLWNNWQDKTATFTVAYNANAQEGLTSMANTVLRKIYDAMDASGIKLKTKVWAARGGIVNYPVYAGEAGQEAIIPLERNLGWMDKMATAISDKITNTKLPDIVTGNILPSTQEFTALMNASTKNIETLLDVIISRLDALESSNHEPIMLQLDSRTVAEVVWDETEKRYKQTGIRYAY